ncbi:hypothetical protein DL96DRAFT_815346 [Flagelloscypha sp. PMI_526]|nr:hypothetical protein DL96DRAFT_815346 [Flagelloscypha sp. PMI_526]
MSLVGALISAYTIHRNALFVDISTLALLVYDTFLTFDTELNVVWSKGGWDRSTILYLSSRYPALIASIMEIPFNTNFTYSGKVCMAIFCLVTILRVFALFMSQVILTMRTVALYHGSRKIFILLCSILAPCFFGGLGLLIHFLYLNERMYLLFSHRRSFTSLCFPAIDPIPGFPFPGCVRRAAPGLDLLIIFIIMMFYEFCVMVLLIWQMVKLWRRGQMKHKLIKVIYRDALSSYTFIFAMSLWNVVSIARQGPLAYVLINLVLVTHALLTSRIALRIREEASPDIVETEMSTHCGTTTLAPLDTMGDITTVSSAVDPDWRDDGC